MNKVVVLKTVVVTRKIVKKSVAPVATKFAKHAFISFAADTLVHHKLPDIIDVVVVNVVCELLSKISE
jgi:hypothetical protein